MILWLKLLSNFSSKMQAFKKCFCATDIFKGDVFKDKQRHTKRNYISSEFCSNQFFFPIFPNRLYLLLYYSIFVLIILLLEISQASFLFLSSLVVGFIAFLRLALYVHSLSPSLISPSHTPQTNMSQCPRLE